MATLIGLIAALLLAIGAARAQPAETVSLRVAAPQVRAVDGITVDVEMSALRNSSNVRLIVVPLGTPDAVGDGNAFAAVATRISGARLRLTLPPGPPGADEVRLYHIPATASAYEIAARAPVTVAPGVPGAVLPTDLGGEARTLGPVRFEARYRDTPILVQAQFLRVRPDTDWDTHWFGDIPVAQAARQFAVISLGTRGIVRDSQAPPREVVCVLDAGNKPMLQAIAALSPGDAVLVRGEPSTWSAAGAADPIILRGCAFAK